MTEPHVLRAEEVRLGYDGREVLCGLSFEVPPGEVTMIVGPNGCGKSTLLRALARLQRPASGAVCLDGRNIRTMSTRQVAAVLGILPQTPVAPPGIRVVELVGQGRQPHQGWLRRWGDEDESAVAQALLATDTLELAERLVDELSGGQRQRVWIAMALAQRTGLLLLDEPTTYLDVPHQVEVLDLLTDLNRGDGTTVVAVLHDLNLACRYADHIVVMAGGAIVAEGPPSRIVTEDLMRTVFGMDCRVIADPVSDTPLIVPIGRHYCTSASTGPATGAVSPRRSRSPV
ncbi:cobalamin/Fe3+-siderophore ABC transporter ATP-binding protein [Streptomyces albospinus]|uniref:Cobalamin/Fe3+-siderophore ABC transporter ATP-binding protein n=1 Tax=Streptomyces albospinus TaxID=285515 RepID=A0ABQ2UPS6_9ACTN|nr:ABC transporter ATP-binding protein [Streptomyces albospinus]GGU47346.1 cobalamin/Fe3+-siderophore ABC transporter ATP-binding protein [Streptomyces albospinus]